MIESLESGTVFFRCEKEKVGENKEEEVAKETRMCSVVFA